MTPPEKKIFKFTLLISSSYGYSLTFSILPFKGYIIEVSYITPVVIVEGRFLLGILVLICSFPLVIELKIALMHENSQMEQRKGGGSCILGQIFLLPVAAESPYGI